MEIGYRPRFIRQLNELEPALREEVIKKIEEFKNPANHRRLRVHALKGRLEGFYSFSVNYKHRVVFTWVGKGKQLAGLEAVGDHDVYS